MRTCIIIFFLSISGYLFSQKAESPYLKVITKNANIPLKSTKATVQIVGTIENQINYDQEFIYFFQIKNPDNSIISLSWIQGKLSSNQILDISQSWIPKNSGNYVLETYVWNSLNELIPLSPPNTTIITID